MKKSKYFFLLLVVLLSACSSSDSTPEEEQQDLSSEITFSMNGTTIDFSRFKMAYRDVHTVCVGAENYNSPFFITFDENGNFGKLSYVYHEPLSGLDKRFTSSADFSSNYFNFNMVSYDAIHKRVKVTFEGYIFYNPLDLNSESKFVSGGFDFPIEDYVPTVANLTNEATINGNYWRYTNIYQKRAGNYHTITLHTMDDGPYKIMITYNDDYTSNPLTGTQPGTYNFTPTSAINKVQVAKYDVATSSYTFYDCTGTLNITNGTYLFLQGTYDLTGVNPADSSDNITVQNGKFKLYYDRNH